MLFDLCIMAVLRSSRVSRFFGLSGGTTEEHKFISLTAGSSHQVKLGSVSILQLLTVAQAQRMEKPFDSHQQ